MKAAAVCFLWSLRDDSCSFRGVGPLGRHGQALVWWFWDPGFLGFTILGGGKVCPLCSTVTGGLGVLLWLSLATCLPHTPLSLCVFACLLLPPGCSLHLSQHVWGSDAHTAQPSCCSHHLGTQLLAADWLSATGSGSSPQISREGTVPQWHHSWARMQQIQQHTPNSITHVPYLSFLFLLLQSIHDLNPHSLLAACQ